MRILVLIHEFPPIGGGGGQVAQDVCRGLVARGHEVRVITAHLNGLPMEEKMDGCEVIRLPSWRKQAYRAGLMAMAVYTFSAIFRGLRLVRDWRPDVIHAHFAVPAGAVAWVISRLRKIPYVLTAHLGDVPGGTPEKTKGWFRIVYPFTPAIWKSAAAISAVSEYTRQLALSRYHANIQVIPNGINLDELNPGTIAANVTPVIVFAGRFVAQKDPVQVARSLAKLRDLPWRCIMLGDGPLRKEVEAEIQRHKLENRFLLTGWVNPNDVTSWFRQCDILFMPSKSEGMPVVGLQAMALGLALVVSQVGGFVELVEPGLNGYLFDPESPEEAMKALLKLISDPHSLQSCREASRKRAERFKLETVVESYEQLLSRVAGR